MKKVRISLSKTDFMRRVYADQEKKILDKLEREMEYNSYRRDKVNRDWKKMHH